jgi:DNA-directed RNA polymerase specialized sigma24 family protein
LESLEYLLPDSIIIRPNFDEELLSKERDVQLQEAVQRLTKHDQILVNLWRQGNSIEEIAKEMGIKKRSVSREISAVVKKLKRIFGEASTFVLTLWPFISASYFVCVGGGNGLANQL